MSRAMLAEITILRCNAVIASLCEGEYHCKEQSATRCIHDKTHPGPSRPIVPIAYRAVQSIRECSVCGGSVGPLFNGHRDTPDHASVFGLDIDSPITGIKALLEGIGPIP